MRKYGYLRELPDQRDWKYSRHPEYKATPLLPYKVDLREQMSAVEDQLSLGSCVANATCGALEYLELKAILNHESTAPEVFDKAFKDISRLYVYFNARAIDRTQDRDAGTYIRNAVMTIRDLGICREALWPYVAGQVFNCPSAQAYEEGQKHKVLSGYRLDHEDLDELKQCLANGFPFIFGMTLYDSFQSSKVAQTGHVPLPSMKEKVLGGHAMLCVGYDDALDSFIVRNSWGVHWGLQGYCYIPTAYMTHRYLAADFWTLRKELGNGSPLGIDPAVLIL